MVQEIGETRDQMSLGLVQEIEKVVDNLKAETEPYYIVFAAKPDKGQANTIKTAIKMYRDVPPGILGILVWYVDNSKGIFEFKPALSSPPDVPVDPSLLSTNKQDLFPHIAKQGQILQVVY